MIVAVLEDCPAQRDWVTKLLHDRGHQVVARGDGDSFIALLRSQVVDAALLDWEAPGASGLSVLSWARSNLNRSMPILMLTQRDDEDDVVTALNAGADDYLHALRERELLARVAAQARRSRHADAPGQELQVGPYAFDLQSRRLTVQGRPVSLPAREFELAALLFRNPGRILTRTRCASTSGAPWTGSTTPAWPRTSATCARRWACARATAMWSPRSTTTDTAWSAWPDFSGMVGYGAVEFSGFASQRHGACALP